MTLKITCGKYITQLLTESKESMSINYLNYKGILGYNIGNTSLIGNAFVVANPDYDFYMNVNSRGVFSLRSQWIKLDVFRDSSKNWQWWWSYQRKWR